MADTVKEKSPVEKWVMVRPEFLAICNNNAHVYAALKVAAHENWPVERFLELCVTVLAKANASLMKDILHCELLENPGPIVVGGVEYQYVPPSPK